MGSKIFAYFANAASSNIEEDENTRIEKIKRDEKEKYGEIDEIFKKHDIDCSGYLAQKEFINAINEYTGLHKDKEEKLRAQLETIDFSTDNLITLFDFRLIIQLSVKDELEITDIVEVFKLFDKNLAGQIATDELIHVMSKLGLNLSIQEAEDLLKEGDCDGDLVLDFEEFLKIVLTK